jgi:phytoene dehydrogenase-like protein
VKGRVVIIGGGIGGLTAALRLARRGYAVRILEAREQLGGLASAFVKDGLRFDGGPYILLDRPGLEWVFRTLGLSLADSVTLRRIEHVYEVVSGEGPPLHFHASLAETAAGLDRLWPGSGERYTRFVGTANRTYDRLQPLLFVSQPGAWDVLRTGAWREAPTLMRSLGAVLRNGLPAPVADAVSVWTHIAGRRIEEAPSFLAFVPALIHGVGAYYPSGGVETIPRALTEATMSSGVTIEPGVRARTIRCEAGRVTGVETETGLVEADAVVSNVGLATYTDLVRPTPPAVSRWLAPLPLQSPGVCAYLRVRGEPRPPYLRFRIDGTGCRLFVATGVVAERSSDGFWPARLIAPVDHDRAERGGPDWQQAYLDRLLAEDWWRQGLDEVNVVARRIPATWGPEFHLHRDAMNPVMTAKLMRSGRLAHRSPWVRGLYLAGAATHPGQWVSFCAISGILAADCLAQDLD